MADMKTNNCIHKRNPSDSLRLNFLIFESERFLTKSVSFIPTKTRPGLAVCAKTHVELNLKHLKTRFKVVHNILTARTLSVCIVFKNRDLFIRFVGCLLRMNRRHSHFNTLKIVQLLPRLFQVLQHQKIPFVDLV
jgi:hypothetical protein